MSETNGAAPAPVAKVGFTEIATRDVDALAAHYGDVLGFVETARNGSTAYLTTGADHHCLLVTEGEPHGRLAVGYQLRSPVAEAEAALKARGIAAERRSDPQPGIKDALFIEEPGTGAHLILYEVTAESGVSVDFGLRPTKLGHVAAFVPDIPQIQGFYEDILGFRFSDSLSDWFIFLRCNADHHAANFMNKGGKTGLHHTAYETRNIVHLKDMLDNLAVHGVRLKWGVGRHGPGHNIFSYHQDPDGNTIELFTEIDVLLDESDPHWEPRPWHEESPMGPKVWEDAPETANQWGPLGPEVTEH